MFKPKPCRKCDTMFHPTAPCNLYCSPLCKEEAEQEAYERGWRNREMKVNPNYGVGKGGMNKKGREDGQYKTGKGFLNANRHRFKEMVRYCEDCGKDLLDASGRNSFCVHHRDHNRNNNPEDFSNWELLCPRCHHLHHGKQAHLNVQRPVREDVQELGVPGNGEEPTGS